MIIVFVSKSNAPETRWHNKILIRELYLEKDVKNKLVF